MFYHEKSGLWFPDGETHFTGTTKKGQPVWQGYQHDRIDAALPWVTDFRVAIDVGAHVGLITRRLAELFDQVYALEPHPETFGCLQKNTAGLTNVLAVNWALGRAAGAAGIESGRTSNSGDRQILPEGGDVLVQIRPLDSVSDLPGCGLLKLDVQGYEAEVLAGAQRTIAAFAPVIIMECEPPGKLRREYGPPGAAAALVAGWGGAQVASRGADQIWAFPPSAVRTVKPSP